MKGYQYLENDFFELCKTRKIHRIPMLLYIYLRGLYCRFQKPDFFWPDETIRTHIGISQSTLQRARSYLQERGLIKYRSGIGRSPTRYTLLATTLLPRVVKLTPQTGRNHVRQTGQINHSIYKREERDKKKVCINRPFERYSPNDKESIKLKNRLNLL